MQSRIEGIARGDNIAVDGRIVKLRPGPPSTGHLDAGRIGVIVGRKYVSCGVRAGERRRGKCGDASAMSANRMVMRPHALRRWVDAGDCRGIVNPSLDAGIHLTGYPTWAL